MKKKRKDLELIEMINTRILHDLAGPIGAIDSCLELLDTTDKDIGEKAKKVAIEESACLVRKIDFLRGVYCFSGDDMMSVVYLRKLLGDFGLINDRIKLDSSFEIGMIDLDDGLARAALCLATVISECVDLGGKITFFCGRDKDDIFIKLESSSDKIKLSDESMKILNDGKIFAISVKNCREYYINALCSNNGYKIAVAQKENLLECVIFKASASKTCE